MLSASNTGSSLPNCESRNSAMFTWPVETARRMSGCLISEPFECTVMSSAPSVAFFTSSTNARTLRVWNSPSEFDVGAEAGLAGQVERHVHAEAAGLGHRVDQAGKRRAARERVVIALRIELARRELARVAFDAFRHARGLQTRAVDEQPGPYLFISRSQDDSVGSNFGLVQGTLQREHRAVRLGVAEVREHQRVAVDDAGRGRVV